MDEVWRVVEEYPEYHVSNFGNVKSFKYGKERDMRKSIVLGYFSVQLWKNNIGKNMRVHRLVAQAFIPNPENKPYINHIDGDKTNNKVENLEWCTPLENERHSRSILGKDMNGEKNCNSYITSEQVIYAVELEKSGLRYPEISKKTGIKSDLLYKILNGASWSSVTGITKSKGRPKGERNGYSKLHDKDIPIIMDMLNNGYTVKEIAEKFNVQPPCIQKIKSGMTWNHITGFPKYTPKKLAQSK